MHPLVNPDLTSSMPSQFRLGEPIRLSEPVRWTKDIFTFVASSDVFSIVGGGHTVAAIEQLGLNDKISHISTGGGSLEKFIMGESLPVVEALKKAKEKFS